MPPSFRSYRYTSLFAAGDKKAFSCDQRSGQDRQPARRTATILVVDDEADIVRLMKRLLCMKGHTVRTAENGKEGLDIFKAGGIDLVLSDFHMHGGNGLEMLREIKKLEPDAKVIMMSGDATETERAEMLAAGASAVFGKPFTPAKLLEAIKNALK